MKRFFLIIVFFSLVSFGQENEYNALRNNAIILTGNDLFKFYNNESTKNNRTENWKIYLNNFRNKIDNLYLIDENDRPIIVSSKESKINFKTIDIYDSKNRKLLKKGIDVWKVFSLLNGNQLTISIIYFKINYKGGKYLFGNGGGSTIVFEYSCEEKKWKLTKEEHKGI